jgi:RNA polymerase-binding transcription factor DksA
MTNASVALIARKSQNLAGDDLIQQFGSGGSSNLESGMNAAALKKLRQQLEAISSRVRSDASAMVEQARSPTGGNAGSELSNAPFHLGDMGTDEFLYDMNTTLLANEQYIVSEARDALRRIDLGTYGICQQCGQPIAKARLEAVPYTRYCVKCAEIVDATPQVSLNEGRPRTPQDTLAPEGEMQENRLRPESPLESLHPPARHGDSHAVGTAGGGTAIGGLAGANVGDGDPIIAELDDAMGSSNFDAEDGRGDERLPRSGPSGGAVGGTPARKRAT